MSHASCAVALFTCSEKNIEAGGAPKEVAEERAPPPKVVLQESNNPFVQMWYYIKYFGLSVKTQFMTGLLFDVHQNVSFWAWQALLSSGCCSWGAIAIQHAAWGHEILVSKLKLKHCAAPEQRLRQYFCSMRAGL